MLLWCIAAAYIALHFVGCVCEVNTHRWRGWGIGFILVALAVSNANAAEFTISATQHQGVLTIVPNTCGKVSHVEVITNPPHEGIIEIGGLYQISTPVTSGVFKCILCENNSCTPIEIAFFDVKVIGANTPTLAGAKTPNWLYTSFLVGALIVCIVAASWIFALICFPYGSCYDEDQNG